MRGLDVAIRSTLNLGKNTDHIIKKAQLTKNLKEAWSKQGDIVRGLGEAKQVSPGVCRYIVVEQHH